MPFYARRKRTTTRRRRSSAVSRRRARRSAPRQSRRYPVRFRGSRSRYAFAKRVSNAINSVAENVLISNRYNALQPRAFSHLATDGYQLSLSLGHLKTENQAQGVDPTQGLRLFNIKSTQMAGDYVFGKRLAIKMGIFMKPVGGANLDATSPDDAGKWSGPLQFDFKLLKLNTKYTPNFTGTGMETVLGSQVWIDEAGQPTGFNEDRSFSQLDLKTYLLNKKRFNVIRHHQFKLSPPMASAQYSDEVPATANTHLETFSGLAATGKQYPSVKYFSLSCPIGKKLAYFDNDTTGKKPDNYNDGFYVLITATQPNEVARLANNWEAKMNTTLIYTDL